MATINQDELKRLLSYDPETGIFRWLVVSPKHPHLLGSVAGTAYAAYCEAAQKYHGEFARLT